MRFKSKVVVITGGAWGLGRAVAQGFAQEGGISVIMDISEENAPYRSRTCDTLIKRQRSSVPLSSLHSQGVPSRPDPKNHFVPDGTSSPVQSH